MNNSFPSAIVRAYLAALGQITAHLQQGYVKRQQEPAGPPPKRRSSDRYPPTPYTR